MNIGISTLFADWQGALQLHSVQSPDMKRIERRAQSVDVLDGAGAVVHDRGVFFAGQRWVLRWRVDGSGPQIARLVELYPQIRVTSEAGVFLAVPQSYEEIGAESAFTLIITERES